MKKCMGCMREYDENRDSCPVCNYSMEQYEAERKVYQDALPQGTKLAQRFVIGKVLNGNDFSYVYIAWDELLRRRVAIKEYFPADIAIRSEDRLTVCPSEDKEKMEGFDTGKSAFEDECLLLHRNQDIRTIAAVYRCLQENNTIYMVMEYLKGETLTEALMIDPKLELGVYNRNELLKNLIIAVRNIQDRNIPHMHLSPDNIYIEDTGAKDDKNKVRLIGFNYARTQLYDKYSAVGKCFSVNFCAPEVLRRTTSKTAADLYSLGCILYCVIMGKLPEESRSRLKKHKPLKIGKKSDELSQVINGLANPMKGERTVDWDRLLELIEGL